MKLNIYGAPNFEGTYEFATSKTLKEIYTAIGGESRPVLIQVGGALGPLLLGYDINMTLDTLTDKLYEPALTFYQKPFCPVDFLRFMTRFVIRELNIINDTLRDFYQAIERLITGKATSLTMRTLEAFAHSASNTKGEALLKSNTLTLMAHFQTVFLEHVDGFCRGSICRTLFDAQCINACPAHIHIPGFVALMKEKRYSEAYLLMRQENPLSSICGSICARPCETRCRRGEINDTVGVRAIQRFISSQALMNWQQQEECLPDKCQSIGIIGGGPAGLSAAYFLRRTGYQVTIYEREAHMGGMMRFGIPAYRLSEVTLQNEIQTIGELGVNYQMNFSVDQESYEQLKSIHDSLILATGTTEGRSLPLAHKNVLTGIGFLKAVRLESGEDFGRRIVVIGGGDVAFDCARTAIRLGCEVTLLSLEKKGALPANGEEIHAALAEGVCLKSGYAVDHIEGDTLHLKKCLRLFDDAGKFDPVYEEVAERLSGIDTIITCVGQKANLSYLDHLAGDSLKEKLETEHRVFAAGDMLKPTIIIDAIAQGKQVASAVDLVLGGSGLNVGPPIEIPERVLDIRTFDMDPKREGLLRSEDRKHHFQPVVECYSEEDAMVEAERCMRCDRNSKATLLLGR